MGGATMNMRRQRSTMLSALVLWSTYLAYVRANCRVDCTDRANVTVEPGGRGDCDSIQAAINCAPQAATARFSVLVSPGVYREQVVVNRSQLSIIGLSPVSGAVTLQWSVPGAAVLNVTANDFVLANLTVFNDANTF